MGLNVSHNCWNGAYGTFRKFRQSLANYIDMDLESMEGFGGEIPFPSKDVEPLVILLDHSDCDGIIEHKDTKKLAKRMDEILLIAENDESGIIGLETTYFLEKLDIFIEGLLTAYAKGDDVIFR